jgi:hypothetical protein
MKAILIVVVVIVLVAVAVIVLLAAQFKTRIDGARKVVNAAQLSAPSDQAAIPMIIRTFALRNGGTVGGPLTVLAHQRDEMRLAPDQPFFALDATQLSGTRDPVFVWEAKGNLATVLPIRVVDSYAAEGWLEVRIAGTIPVAKASGPDIDKGETMRFMAELAWNPDAILNASALRWRQIDAKTVEVSIDPANGNIAVRQVFDENGDIVAIETDDRPYVVDGKSVPTRWVGRFRDYALFGSYRLPRYGEVAWVLPQGEFVYFRGTITGFEPTKQDELP